ncbi:MAG: MSEP-CTERM sorting domain-containing protein [Bacteroidetes bacterium]|nr:MSEP-CTERM sorting domain-containing protein [Bacteroidota bacterium]
MQKLLKPQWILLANSLPIGILFFLKYSEYTLIKTMLPEESLGYWISFASVLIILALLSLSYSLYGIAKGKSISLIYALSSLIAYLAFAYLYYNFIDHFSLFNIPAWMVDDFAILHLGSFLMPSLAHSLLAIVLHLSPVDLKTSTWKNFGFAALVPILAYLSVELIIPLWQPTSYLFKDHVLVVLSILGTLCFLFFLVRGLFSLFANRGEQWSKYSLAWKIPISLLLPLLGLAVNQGFIIENWHLSDKHILGNYGSVWFPILTIVNGLLICLPDFKNVKLRLLRFAASISLFSYTTYFFIVFLPFLPFSVMAILAFGVGLLLLAPLLLFGLQAHQLSQDFNFLKPQFGASKLRILGSLGFILLPLLFSLNLLFEKRTLHEALDYISNSNFEEEYAINTEALQHSLSVLKDQKQSRGFGLFGQQTPYLSTYYNWLVLDNLTISDAKINKLECVFFDEVPIVSNSIPTAVNDSVQISNLNISSRYDSLSESWTSWLELEITNKDLISWQREYATNLYLPEGCYISDYYLYVGDRKEMGILAEKKAALWIYSQIRSYRRDPGILYYKNARDIGFRVFPFARGEIRKTGIEFKHKTAFNLKLDNYDLQFGNDSLHPPRGIESEGIAFISAEDKKRLRPIKRKPYFHFILDQSRGEDRHYQKNLEQLADQYPNLMPNAKISLVNAYVKTFNWDDDWSASAETSGGFNLDRAIKQELIKHYNRQTNDFPVFVVLSDSINEALLDNGYKDYSFCFPEMPYFFHLNADQSLIAHSLIQSPYLAQDEEISPNKPLPVLGYDDQKGGTHYIPDNQQNSIVLVDEQVRLEAEQIETKAWLSGLKMEGQWRAGLLKVLSDENWRNLVMQSFKAQIMNPYTSFLVVENEAQKEMLKRKQAEVLAGKKSLDAGEETLAMSEPEWYIIALLFGLFVWLRSRKVRRSSVGE